jgi:DUF1365 family protein
VSSALYTGHVVHARHDEVARRAFRYPLYVACLDLDDLPRLGRSLRLFGYNRSALFGLADRDYEGAAGSGLAAAHRQLAAARGLPAATQVRLITQLRAFGYVFNPVSFFLGEGAAGRLAYAVAEINNNYGGRHQYVLGPAERVDDPRGHDRFRVAKAFFVSPFIHGPATYDFSFDAPSDGDRLAISARVTRPDGRPFFHARLEGRRRPLDDRTLAWAAARYPLMTVQVIGLIHWQALRLRLRGAPYRRPGPDHRPTDPPAVRAR